MFTDNPRNKRQNEFSINKKRETNNLKPSMYCIVL